MDDRRAPLSGRQRDKDTREAAEWFSRWQSGTVDEAAFARWRDVDPARALAFARVAAAWEAASPAGEVAQAPLVGRRMVVRGGMAGAFLLAAGTGLVATRAYAWDRASTGIGETRKLRLPDNSMAALNTDTSLSWRFSRSGRELWLERGEVALDLQPGSAAQLGTENGDALLEAGRFNVRLKDAALELTALRGQARIARAAARPLEVDAYHRLVSTQQGPRVVPMSPHAVEATLAWQSGDIVFLDTPLAEAAAEYNRYLQHRIVIEDPALETVRVGGRFITSDPTDFLQAVSTSLGIRVHTTATAHHLSS
jgi:transmembrane sensor